MKSIFIIALTICLILLLPGYGSSHSSEVDNYDETAEEYEEQSENTTDGDYFGLGDQEIVIETGIGEDGGEATVKTGSNIKWDPEKMGGMPQPEGTTIVMETDMSKTLGKEIAYSYVVTGLTKKVFEEYIKLASETFPKVMQNTLKDNEGTFMATTEDLEQNFSVGFNGDKLSYIQYIN